VDNRGAEAYGHSEGDIRPFQTEDPCRFRKMGVVPDNSGVAREVEEADCLEDAENIVIFRVLWPLRTCREIDRSNHKKRILAIESAWQPFTIWFPLLIGFSKSRCSCEVLPTTAYKVYPSGSLIWI
jgi:hypothetical protein